MPVWACLKWEELVKSPSLSFHNELKKMSDCVANRKKKTQETGINCPVDSEIWDSFLYSRNLVSFFLLTDSG